MSENSQRRAIETYRARMAERGIVRFEVRALKADRDLIRALARKLAEAGPDATALRGQMRRALAGSAPKTGGVLAALRRSPLVGADLDLDRPREEGRKVDL